MMAYDGVAIIGAAELPYARKLSGATTVDLLKAVFLRALAHAGIEHRAVDGIAVSSFTLKPDHAIDVAWQLGLSPRWCMEDTLGGASGINMLQHAARAIQAGDAETIVILSADHFQAGDFKDLVENYNRTTRDHLAPLSFGGPNGLFALVTQRHAKAHGLGRADYGAVCVAQRDWARRNPQAVYRSELTLEDYLAQPFIADPLCRYDCVPVVSGADAIVLTATDHAGSGRQVGIRALAARYNPDHQEGTGCRTSLADLAPALWRDADAGPEEMDIVSIYDDYPVMVLAQLADLGFVPDGDLSRFIQDRLRTGTLAVNTSGGQLSAGQAGAAGGLHGLVEAVIQLRHEAGERQVPDARLATVAGYGMVEYRYGMCANVVVLEGSDR
ncbi:MAG TPA: thiolase family protein [Stellaceae bacterium]|nr:thiolase family protein [Stellaceae bacterium]